MLRMTRKILLVGIGVVFGLSAAGAATGYYAFTRQAKTEFSLAAVKCEMAYSVVGKSSHGPRLQLYVKTDEIPSGQRVHFSVHAMTQIISKAQPDSAKLALMAFAGPSQRAAMRAPYLGSEVIYVADAENHPDVGGRKNYRGYVIDAEATDDGGFYGLRMPAREASINAILKDGDPALSCQTPSKPDKSA